MLAVGLGTTAGRQRAAFLVALFAVLAFALVACSSGAAGGPTGGSTGGSGTAQAGTGGAMDSGGHAGLGAGGAATGGASQGSTGGTMGNGSGGSGSGGSTGGAAGTAASTGGAAGGVGPGGSGGRAFGSGGVAGGGGTSALDLFNGTDLSGFNVYKATSTANNAPGTLLSPTDGQTIFKPENGTIHVYGDLPDQSTQVHYLLQTVASYGKYNLSWEYKWGVKKFAPYTDLAKYPRDAGVLWHIHGDRTQVWPSSIEFQNKWGSTGDIFALYARCTSLGAANDPTQFADTAAGGAVTTVDGSNGLVQHMRAGNFEMPGVGAGASTGEGSDWNTCLLQVDGGAATYVVNGHVVNRVLSVTDKTGKAVTSGPIAWQAEQAEVYYRNLRIQVLQ